MYWKFTVCFFFSSSLTYFIEASESANLMDMPVLKLNENVGQHMTEFLFGSIANPPGDVCPLRMLFSRMSALHLDISEELIASVFRGGCLP
jgi:hypothetical protein